MSGRFLVLEARTMLGDWKPYVEQLEVAIEAAKMRARPGRPMIVVQVVAEYAARHPRKEERT